MYEDSHLRYNLQLDPNKFHADEDLKKEIILQHALRLLYAARTGKGLLRRHSGVHIQYTQLDSVQGERLAAGIDMIKKEVCLSHVNPRV